MREPYRVYGILLLFFLGSLGVAGGEVEVSPPVVVGVEVGVEETGFVPRVVAGVGEGSPGSPVIFVAGSVSGVAVGGVGVSWGNALEGSGWACGG
jgi:hypothetical protein